MTGYPLAFRRPVPSVRTRYAKPYVPSLARNKISSSVTNRAPSPSTLGIWRGGERRSMGATHSLVFPSLPIACMITSRPFGETSYPYSAVVTPPTLRKPGSKGSLCPESVFAIHNSLGGGEGLFWTV